MRLVCPDCEIEMRPAQVGVGVEAMSVKGSYQLFMADLYECPACLIRILGAFGQEPLTEHFDPGYKGAVARFDSGGRLFHSWLNTNEKQLFHEREEAPVS